MSLAQPTAPASGCPSGGGGLKSRQFDRDSASDPFLRWYFFRASKCLAQAPLLGMFGRVRVSHHNSARYTQARFSLRQERCG
jgi:hypothetical protein